MTGAAPVQWKLLRLGLLTVGEPPEEFDLGLRMDAVAVDVAGPVRKDGQLIGMLVVAHLDIESGPVAGETYTLPHDLREEAEFALEMVARLVGLDRGVPHRTESPIPCLGFVPSDLSVLAELDGIHVDHQRPPTPMVGQGARGILDTSKGVALLQDRLDGVVLLSEAFNTTGPVGQFTLFWRFFERAFKLGHSDLAPKLKEFLASESPHGFTDEEVQEWVDARNPAVHANRGTRVTLDSEVLQYVRRMTEAAYDVLMNKLNWHSRDSKRRDVWRAPAGSAGPDMQVFVTQGKEVHLGLAMMDEFESFISTLQAPTSRYLPEGLWLHSDATSCTLRWNLRPARSDVTSQEDHRPQ